VSFGFSDSQYVAISVEARREPGETYGPLTGMFKQFELIYVVGDERDLIGSRAVHGDYDVYLYPIRTTRERIRTLFLEMLARSNALATKPEFYNTLTNNCTSNVAFMGTHTRITVQTDAGTLVAIHFRESDEGAVEEEMVDQEVHVWWDPRESTIVAAGDEPQTLEGVDGGGEAV
jgi:hypothetical protein